MYIPCLIKFISYLYITVQYKCINYVENPNKKCKLKKKKKESLDLVCSLFYVIHDISVLIWYN